MLRWAKPSRMCTAVARRDREPWRVGRSGVVMAFWLPAMRVVSPWLRISVV